MKKLVIFLLLISSLGSLRAQVGFNNTNPDPSSLLDLSANDKGLLVPRMTSAFRSAINLPGQSLLVFDTTLQGFYFYNSGTWYSLNEWVKTAGSNNVSLSGNASVTGNFSSGSISNTGGLTTSSVSAGSLSVSGFATNALVPSGAIMMWSGSIASIPGGWALCDGLNGTPNLTDRFIVGAGFSYSVGGNAGANFITLTPNELPSHTHSGSTTTDGLHSHTISYQTKDTRSQNTPGTWENGNTTSKSTSTDGLHSHSLNINATGGNQPFDNRPPFWALAYIMKL